MIRTFVCIISNKLRNIFPITRGYRVRVIDDIPEDIQSEIVYIIGTPSNPQYAIFLCPCGCSRKVELNLNTSSRPCWSIKWHLTGTISFAPSIWRKQGCRSHFFFKKSIFISSFHFFF